MKAELPILRKIDTPLPLQPSCYLDADGVNLLAIGNRQVSRLFAVLLELRRGLVEPPGGRPCGDQQKDNREQQKQSRQRKPKTSTRP
jgi:hypothetical protein